MGSDSSAPSRQTTLAVLCAILLSVALHAGVWWGASRWLTSSSAGAALAPVLRRLLAEDPAANNIKPYSLPDEIMTYKEWAMMRPSNFFVPPRTRNDVGLLLEALGFTTGVELGVQTGAYANILLSTWPSCTKYYLVDLWAHQENYHDLANADQATQDRIYDDARKNLERWADKTVFIRNYTSLAVAWVPDSVDFVYVDARHDFCGVYEDILLYWPKIKPGGVMAGHDYRNAFDVKRDSGQDWSVCLDGSKHHGAVMGAVNRFAMLHGLHVSVTYNTLDNDWPSWFIRKPMGPLHHQPHAAAQQH